MKAAVVKIQKSNKSALSTFERRVLSARQSADECGFTEEFGELTKLLHKIEAAYLAEVEGKSDDD